jgi:hypothetical protein
VAIGSLLTLLRSVSYSDGLLSILVVAIFCITLLITMSSILRKNKLLLITTLAFNVISVLYGVRPLYFEAATNDEMWILVAIVPFLIVVAVSISCTKVVKQVRAKDDAQQ